MYEWIWRHLPGDRLNKALWSAAIVAVVVALLWFWVFPWVEPHLRYDHGTVQNGTSPSPGPGRQGPP